ncbi:MAG: sulfite exporter TauE/SafE family protein [Mycobacterium sp.]|nr:sulfite exporter TauE/SafE family protein [Mycobacterium sp.]
MTTTAGYLIYLSAGLVAGLLAGMFGLGGGLTIVPALSIALPLQGVLPGQVMHLAVGTSLGAMFLTALYTTLLRRRHGDLDLAVFGRLLPPVVAGAIAGALLGGFLPGHLLRIFFIAFVAYMIVRALRQHFRSAARVGEGTTTQRSPTIPSAASRWVSGTATGLTGALLGMGAAVITVPYLKGAGYRIQTASAVAAGLSAVIGLGAGAGYILGGMGAEGLPEGAIGYLYLPAFVGMTIGALIGSPFGVRISHRMNELRQFWLFLAYLVVVLIAMVVRA